MNSQSNPTDNPINRSLTKKILANSSIRVSPIQTKNT